MTRNLAVTRSADRRRMAADLARLAGKYGLDANMQPGHFERELVVAIEAPLGLRLAVSLDGDSKQQRRGVHVLSWCMAARSPATLSADFAVRANASVNQYHRQKATVVTEGGFPALQDGLERAFACISDGSAYATNV